jgi:acetylornithine deacetylase/succinyl-diaminopimelate desuccinylase-like protein
MRLLAGAVVFLAVAVLAQPVVQRVFDDYQNSVVAAQCWAPGSLRSVTSIVHDEMIRKIKEEVRKSASANPPSSDQIEKNLSVKIEQPFYQEGSKDASAKCGADITVSYRDLSANAVVSFTLSRGQVGSTALISKLELLHLFGELESKVTAPK